MIIKKKNLTKSGGKNTKLNVLQNNIGYFCDSSSTFIDSPDSTFTELSNIESNPKRYSTPNYLINPNQSILSKSRNPLIGNTLKPCLTTRSSKSRLNLDCDRQTVIERVNKSTNAVPEKLFSDTNPFQRPKNQVNNKEPRSSQISLSHELQDVERNVGKQNNSSSVQAMNISTKSIKPQIDYSKINYLSKNKTKKIIPQCRITNPYGSINKHDILKKIYNRLQNKKRRQKSNPDSITSYKTIIGNSSYPHNKDEYCSTKSSYIMSNKVKHKFNSRGQYQSNKNDSKLLSSPSFENRISSRSEQITYKPTSTRNTSFLINNLLSEHSVKKNNKHNSPNEGKDCRYLNTENEKYMKRIEDFLESNSNDIINNKNYSFPRENINYSTGISREPKFSSLNPFSSIKLKNSESPTSSDLSNIEARKNTILTKLDNDIKLFRLFTSKLEESRNKIQDFAYQEHPPDNLFLTPKKNKKLKNKNSFDSLNSHKNIKNMNLSPECDISTKDDSTQRRNSCIIKNYNTEKSLSTDLRLNITNDLTSNSSKTIKHLKNIPRKKKKHISKLNKHKQDGKEYVLNDLSVNLLEPSSLVKINYNEGAENLKSELLTQEKKKNSYLLKQGLENFSKMKAKSLSDLSKYINPENNHYSVTSNRYKYFNTNTDLLNLRDNLNISARNIEQDRISSPILDFHSDDSHRNIKPNNKKLHIESQSRINVRSSILNTFPHINNSSKNSLDLNNLNIYHSSKRTQKSENLKKYFVADEENNSLHNLNKVIYQTGQSTVDTDEPTISTLNTELLSNEINSDDLNELVNYSSQDSIKPSPNNSELNILDSIKPSPNNSELNILDSIKPSRNNSELNVLDSIKSSPYNSELNVLDSTNTDVGLLTDNLIKTDDQELNDSDYNDIDFVSTSLNKNVISQISNHENNKLVLDKYNSSNKFLSQETSAIDNRTCDSFYDTRISTSSTPKSKYIYYNPCQINHDENNDLTEEQLINISYKTSTISLKSELPSHTVKQKLKNILEIQIDSIISSNSSLNNTKRCLSDHFTISNGSQSKISKDESLKQIKIPSELNIKSQNNLVSLKAQSDDHLVEIKYKPESLSNDANNQNTTQEMGSMNNINIYISPKPYIITKSHSTEDYNNVSYISNELTPMIYSPQNSSNLTLDLESRVIKSDKAQNVSKQYKFVNKALNKLDKQEKKPFNSINKEHKYLRTEQKKSDIQTDKLIPFLSKNKQIEKNKQLSQSPQNSNNETIVVQLNNESKKKMYSPKNNKEKSMNKKFLNEKLSDPSLNLCNDIDLQSDNKTVDESVGDIYSKSTKHIKYMSNNINFKIIDNNIDSNPLHSIDTLGKNDNYINSPKISRITTFPLNSAEREQGYIQNSYRSLYSINDDKAFFLYNNRNSIDNNSDMISNSCRRDLSNRNSERVLYKTYQCLDLSNTNDNADMISSEASTSMRSTMNAVNQNLQNTYFTSSSNNSRNSLISYSRTMNSGKTRNITQIVGYSNYKNNLSNDRFETSNASTSTHLSSKSQPIISNNNSKVNLDQNTIRISNNSYKYYTASQSKIDLIQNEMVRRKTNTHYGEINYKSDTSTNATYNYLSNYDLKTYDSKSDYKNTNHSQQNLRYLNTDDSKSKINLSTHLFLSNDQHKQLLSSPTYNMTQRQYENIIYPSNSTNNGLSSNHSLESNESKFSVINGSSGINNTYIRYNDDQQNVSRKLSTNIISQDISNKVQPNFENLSYKNMEITNTNTIHRLSCTNKLQKQTYPITNVTVPQQNLKTNNIYYKNTNPIYLTSNIKQGQSTFQPLTLYHPVNNKNTVSTRFF